MCPLIGCPILSGWPRNIYMSVIMRGPSKCILYVKLTNVTENGAENLEDKVCWVLEGREGRVRNVIIF